MGGRVANIPPAPHSPLPTPRRVRWAVWLATGCGAGYLPFMPGTYGSALGVLLYLGLAALAKTTPYPPVVLGLAALAVTAISIWIAALALRSFYEPDPQVIVLDEVAGQVLALLPLPLMTPLAPSSYWIAVGIGFLLFRALDAIKPYPIWKAERLHGVWGVMGDDLAAGLLAAAVLGAILWFGFGV